MTTPTPSPAVNGMSGNLEVPDGRLYFEVRGQGPLVVLCGAPMDTTVFAPLAEVLARDRTVLTTDPRGLRRSRLNDPAQDSTPPLRADDLSRLIAHLDAGPAVVMGSSGGAVSALALIVTHPDQVSVVIAHEPPLFELLPERDTVRATVDEIVADHLAGDVTAAWKKFFALADFGVDASAVDEMFSGERDPQHVVDERRWFAHEIRGTTEWQPDIAALRSTVVPLLIGIGEHSAGMLCDRSSRALAAAIGVEPTMFPGGHTGFSEDPELFATRLRAVLREV
jgi:pimeloyl-ACP methyl ester carboxylesterase